MKTSRILLRKQVKKNKKNNSKQNNTNISRLTKNDFKTKTKLRQIISFFRCRGWSISKNRVSP